MEPHYFENLLTLKDAAKQLGVSENTLRSWVHQGRLPVHRLGRTRGTLRIHLDDLLEFVKATRETTKKGGKRHGG